jgi:cell fate regulator YaaT (PSP1 superfamily)
VEIAKAAITTHHLPGRRGLWMDVNDYLLSYGSAGDFGRFYPVKPLTCRRGDRAVVRSHRGLELATVLCAATPGHAVHLPNTTVGQLLRLASAEDEQTAARMHEHGQRIFESARELAADLTLPLEILDVEVLLDGQQAILQLLRGDECDMRQFVSGLSRKHEIQVALHDLSRQEGVEAVETHGCGRPDCGRTGDGDGCSTCGTGGGCATCGAGKAPDMTAYFAGLREQMAANRVPLL